MGLAAFNQARRKREAVKAASPPAAQVPTDQDQPEQKKKKRTAQGE